MNFMIEIGELIFPDFRELWNCCSPLGLASWRLTNRNRRRQMTSVRMPFAKLLEPERSKSANLYRLTLVINF